MARKASEKADWKDTQSYPYAVLRTGGKQYTVSEGDHLLLEKLELEPGATLTADEVLLYAKAPGNTQVGQPLIGGAKVELEVLQQTLGKKIVTRHHRRRHNSQKTLGHRQPLTRVMVKSIKA